MALRAEDREGPPSHVLLVEGADDLHLFGHLRHYHEMDRIFRIVDGGGIDNILKTIPACRGAAGAFIGRLAASIVRCIDNSR